MPIHATVAILVETGAMRGYHSASYGDAFADVYDDWYRDLGDVDATVGLIAQLATTGGSVLELGVGSGRLAIPLAASGLRTTGIDSSAQMLDLLARNEQARNEQARNEQARNDRAPDEQRGRVHAVRGDMVDDMPSGPFDVVLAAYNTVFNLLDRDRQQRCFTEVASRLAPGGSFIVEAFVPRLNPDAGNDDYGNDDGGDGPSIESRVTVRTMSVDRVVLSASRDDHAQQRAEGHFIEITEMGGIRLRPWAIRYASPDELDGFARRSGLALHQRWADFSGAVFSDASDAHVSVYRTGEATSDVPDDTGAMV